MTGRILESNDNGGVPEAVFQRHLTERLRLQKQANDIKAKQKAAAKVAEDDGISVKSMDLALKLAAEDPNEVIRRQNEVGQYLRFMRAKVGEQMSMIDEMPDTSKMSDTARAQKWRDEGWQAGLLGKNREDCPHDPGTPGADEWLAGYEEGQTRNLSKIKGPDGKPVTDSAKKADTPKAPPAKEAPKPAVAKPGRKPKATTDKSAASSSEAAEGASPPAPPSSGDGGKVSTPPAPPPAAANSQADDDAEWEDADPANPRAVVR